MHPVYLIAALFPAAAFATLYGHCSGTATGEYKTDGICDYTTDCTGRGGSHIVGGCPNDPDDVTCCVIGLEQSVATNPCGGSSFCDWTSNSDCGGHFEAGYCPGYSNYQCCQLD